MHCQLSLSQCMSIGKQLHDKYLQLLGTLDVLISFDTYWQVLIINSNDVMRGNTNKQGRRLATP